MESQGGNRTYLYRTKASSPNGSPVRLVQKEEEIWAGDWRVREQRLALALAALISALTEYYTVITPENNTFLLLFSYFF